MTCYRRAIITGTLTTKTNLHIGSGEEAYLDEKKGSVNVVVRTKNKRPYIPASSLRGFLRSQIVDPTLRQAIFGLGRQKSGSEETGNAGQLRIYDAQVSEVVNANYISRTSIDPLTQVAKEHHLSTHEIIPPETEFSLTLELDNSTTEQIKALLQELAILGLSPSGQLGKGKSIGQGKLTWELSKVLGLTEERLQEWLQPPEIKEHKDKKKGKRGKSNEAKKSFSSDADAFRECFEKVEIATDPVTSPWKTIAFTLKSHSPVLINDPQRVKQREQELKKKEDERKDRGEEPTRNKETAPDLIYMLNQEQACIPASTLKGWLRAHCRRILLTIQQGSEEDRFDKLLDEVFGSSDHGRGLLQFEDALAPIDLDKELHPQTFIAVDRFTGGAKPGALYNVEAIWSKESFSSEIHYREGKLESWMKILLLYALRDAMEGDLVLGWGKSRGYGRLILESTGIELGKYREEDLASWRQALQTQLEQEQAA